MFALLTLLMQPAQAVIYSGNPNLGFRVDRLAHDYEGGVVTLDKVRVYNCNSSYTDYEVDDTIDPVALNTLTITGGNLCSLTFYWTTVMDIDGTNGTFTVRYAQSSTSVTLSTDITPVALTPYSVISGSMSGGAPWLLVTID